MNDMRKSVRTTIDNDNRTDDTSATRQCVRIPYQPDTILFGGWGVKL